MLSLPSSGAVDAFDAVVDTARDSVERRRPGLPQAPSLEKRSKARLRCTWKGCTHQEPDSNEMRQVIDQ